MADAIISMKEVNKWYGKFHVLRNINLEVTRGERIVICGPSGSGKSTLIRCINRLEEHQKGHIVVEGTEITNDIRHVEAIRRDVGMVFQHFNLFPHLTVLENLTLGPIWVLKTPKAEAEARAMKYLERVRIAEQAAKVVLKLQEFGLVHGNPASCVRPAAALPGRTFRSRRLPGSDPGCRWPVRSSAYRRRSDRCRVRWQSPGSGQQTSRTRSCRQPSSC